MIQTKRSNVTFLLSEIQRTHLEGTYGLGAQVFCVTSARPSYVKTYHEVCLGGEILQTLPSLDALAADCANLSAV